MEILRTPEDRFADLPGFGYQPGYVELDGLRVAYVDEGPRDADPILLLHGEPSWSFLYRTMIPPLVEAGARVVAPDFVGFGRSDKPAAVADYTYARHVAWMASLLEALDLRDTTLVGQDWGGLIGLRLVAEHPERFARVVAANTGLPTGDRPMPDVWQRFRRTVVSADVLDIARLVAAGCVNPLPPEVRAAYDAPFPSEGHKAGVRAFPDLIPQTLDDPASEPNRRAWEVLAELDLPVLTAFSDRDPITAGGERPLQRLPGAQGQPHTTIAGAGHFLQEDAGPQLARVVADFAAATGARLSPA
jgi:haloalkane dehalogenase